MQTYTQTWHKAVHLDGKDCKCCWTWAYSADSVLRVNERQQIGTFATAGIFNDIFLLIIMSAFKMLFAVFAC